MVLLMSLIVVMRISMRLVLCGAALMRNESLCMKEGFNSVNVALIFGVLLVLCESHVWD